jgi:hypothetical protein
MTVKFSPSFFAFSTISILVLLLAFKPPAAGQELQLKSVSQLKFLNSFVLPHDLQYKKTTVGGLSGIDWDPGSDTYYMICDDRSHRNPARFYTAKIKVSAKGIDTVILKKTVVLRQQDGSSYPEKAAMGSKTSDPESIRYNALNKSLLWTSEGERLTDSDRVLINPAINIVSLKGKYLDTIPLPENLKMHSNESGPRRNGVLEGSTFADNFRNLYICTEEPLYQDGPRADLIRNKAFVRVYKFDMQQKLNTAQYAYELEPIPFPVAKKDGSMNNGVPDILYLGKNRLLITERAFSAGRKGANVKVFLADFNRAENIIGNPSLISKPSTAPVSKRLLLNMDDLGIYIDNIEGATIGPLLPNGHQTLMFIADNNFKDYEQNQFLIFEVIP